MRERVAARVALVLALVLVPNVHAEGPANPRTPDQATEGAVNALAMADDGSLLAATDDPGSTLKGNASVPTWRLWSGAGSPLQSGITDLGSCGTRAGDLCQGPANAAALAPDGRHFAVAGNVTHTVVDATQGVLVLGSAAQGETSATPLSFGPQFVALDTSAHVVAVAGTQTGSLGAADAAVLQLFSWDGEHAPASLGTALMAGHPNGMALSSDGQVAYLAGAHAARLDLHGNVGTIDIGAPVTAVAVAGQAPHTVALGSATGVMFLDDVQTVPPGPRLALPATVASLALNADGTAALAGLTNGNLVRIRIGNGLPASAASDVVTLAHPVTYVAVSPDGATGAAASGSEARQVDLAGPALTVLWHDTLPGPAHVAVAATGESVGAAGGRAVRFERALHLVTATAPAVTLAAAVPFNFTVTFTDVGNRPERSPLTATWPPGWVGSLSMGNVSLEPGSSQSVVVHSVPVAGLKPGDYAVTLTQQRLTSVLNVTMPRIDAFTIVPFGPSSLAVDAGQVAVFVARVTNRGNDHATPRIDVATKPGLWAARTDPAQLDLYPGQMQEVQVILVAPVGAAQGEEGNATLHLPGATASFVATVGGHFEPTLRFPPTATIAAGESQSLTVTLQNAGNAPDTITVAVQPGSVPVGWLVAFPSGATDQQVRDLAPGAAVPLTLTVAVPATATPGAKAFLRIHGASAGDPGKTLDYALTVTVAGTPPSSTSAGKHQPGPAVPLVVAGLLASALLAARRRPRA